jgi:hypothetical protein
MRLFIFCLLLSFPVTAHATERVFESKLQRTHLLELFTSEGCSSCPPAESWLSRFRNSPGLWKDFVPLAFHVDYWDRLGWRDPFASKEWTRRQYEYAAIWQNDSVYTPGFVLDGREWRSRVTPTASTETEGVLKLIINGEKLTIDFQPIHCDSPFTAYAAKLGFGLRSKVATGENKGRDLYHDFVVLSMVSGQLVNGKVELEDPNRSLQAEAIAAWVTASGQLEPIQAVGGWLR